MSNNTEAQASLPSAEENYTHIKCDDAYDGELGKDEGSELYLAKKVNGGLIATIYFNDITAKILGSGQYNFSFNKEQVKQIADFIAAPKEDRIAFTRWCAENYVPVIASKELKYWQKENYQNKDRFYSTEDLYKIFYNGDKAKLK